MYMLRTFNLKVHSVQDDRKESKYVCTSTLHYTLLVNGKLYAGDEKMANRDSQWQARKCVNYWLICINNEHALKLHFYSFSENT
jgi:hypothetical protein